MEWAGHWLWFGAALVLVILEMLMPVQILLGFAIGAAAVGGLFLLDGGIASYLAGSLPITMVIFSVISLVVWLVLRFTFGDPKAQVKYWDKDINDN